MGQNRLVLASHDGGATWDHEAVTDAMFGSSERADGYAAFISERGDAYLGFASDGVGGTLLRRPAP